MSILVVGVNHRSADVALLERVAVPGDAVGKAARTLAAMDHVLEAVVLSTCNRVEVYAHVTRSHPGLLEVLGWFATRGDLDPLTLSDVHYTHHDDRAIAHLFAVASGLDSMVVGEHQIASQVRRAAERARDEETIGRLHELFTRAQHASRRVHSETDISRQASSMVDVGFDVALRRWGGSLAGRTVAVLGAGTMGTLAAARLATEVPARALFWNRDAARTRGLVARAGGEHVVGRVADAIGDADLVVCCTGAAMPTVDAETVAELMASRPGRELVLVDLAMPRNVDPACEAVPGVTVIDLDAIGAVVDASPDRSVLEAARAIVEEEAARSHLAVRELFELDE